MAAKQGIAQPPVAPQQQRQQQVFQEQLNLEVARSKEENGFAGHPRFLDSERAVQELVQESLTKAADEHLVEFSEAMRTVAKALRRVAEGKASAQVEAAEWKRKYELEREQNLQLKHKESVLESCPCAAQTEKAGNVKKHTLRHPESEQVEKCCGKHGICSHEILWNEDRDSRPRFAHNMSIGKALFRLYWGCNGEKNGQHKRDIVSFERGNITTAERSSKQIFLKWESRPRTVLIFT